MLFSEFLTLFFIQETQIELKNLTILFLTVFFCISDDSKSSDISEETYSIPEQSSCYASAVLPSKTNNGKISPAKQAKANTYEKCVPQPDFFAKQKKRNVDTFNKSILDQTKNLNVLAQKVGDALSACASPSPTSHTTEFPSIFSLEVKIMLNSIGFALQRVPETKQLDCLIAIMQLLKQHIEK